MVNHDIVRLHVAMHDAHTVTEVESLQELVQIEPNIIISQRLVQLLKVSIIDVLKYERWSARLFGGRKNGMSNKLQTTKLGRSRLTKLSLTTAWSVIILGPLRRFSKILISRLIFFFLTGWVNKKMVMVSCACKKRVNRD